MKQNNKHLLKKHHSPQERIILRKKKNHNHNKIQNLKAKVKVNQKVIIFKKIYSIIKEKKSTKKPTQISKDS